MTAPRDKAFPVSWDQFHRDARALAWRLASAGPFDAIVTITRGGLVPAAIVARELEIRVIETVCVASYHDYKTQGGLQVLKTIAPDVARLDEGAKVLIVDDLVDTGSAPRSCAKCSRGPISPPSTPSPSGGPWSTPSSPKCRRTPGSIFPGTWASPFSRRSPRTGGEAAGTKFNLGIEETQRGSNWPW
jgi:hypothetical protein